MRYLEYSGYSGYSGELGILGGFGGFGVLGVLGVIGVGYLERSGDNSPFGFGVGWRRRHLSTFLS